MSTFLTVLFSFLVATILAVLPVPAWVNLLWPNWVVLVLIYWVMVMPYRLSVGYAWLIGLFLDVLFGSALGEHALAMIFVAYFMAKFHTRIRLFGFPQQIGIVFVLLLMYRTILLWIEGLAGNGFNILLYWLPSLTGAIFWYWVLILIQDYDKYWKVSE